MIGQWAKATLGDKARAAKIATLDLAANQPTVDYLRHNGFLTGFGIPVKDPKHYAHERQPADRRVRRHAGSDEGGRTAMEKILQKADQIDLVYAINEPAAYGGYAALKAAGKEKGVLVVAVDGGCNGIKSVKDGVIGATSQQYPLLMAADGVAGGRRITSRPARSRTASTPASSSSPTIRCRASHRSASTRA